MQPGIKSSYRMLLKPLLQGFKQTKLWILHCTLPRSPRGWCFTKSCVLHSTPLFMSLLALLSLLALFPPFASLHPSSRQPFSSNRCQRLSLDGLHWDKSSSEDSTAANSYFCDTVNGVANSRLWWILSQMLLKVPSEWVWQFFWSKKKKQKTAGTKSSY